MLFSGLLGAAQNRIQNCFSLAGWAVGLDPPVWFRRGIIRHAEGRVGLDGDWYLTLAGMAGSGGTVHTEYKSVYHSTHTVLRLSE